MKTQNFGRSGSQCTFSPVRPWPRSSPFVLSLKDYRENRENGTDLYNPNKPFPSAGFDKLDIKSFASQSGKYPDPQGRYWWELTLQNGSVNNDFYWMKDEILGFADKSDGNRYWFTVHHAPTNTKIAGFSHEPDYQKGFPDKGGKYWRYIQFTETHCPAIRQWMEKKDRNYQIRQISLLLKMLYQPSKIEEGLNFFTALPHELQLMVLEFVFGVKLTLDLFENARDLVIQKEILTKPTTPVLSKCEEKQDAISQLSLNEDMPKKLSIKPAIPHCWFGSPHRRPTAKEAIETLEQEEPSQSSASKSTSSGLPSGFSSNMLSFKK